MATNKRNFKISQVNECKHTGNEVAVNCSSDVKIEFFKTWKEFAESINK